MVWTLTADQKFSVKSLYRKLIAENLNFPQKFLWKVKVPAKIKVCLWLVNRKSILTRDSLLKRGWQGEKTCVFCGKDESVNHFLFTCSVASLMWSLLQCTFGLRKTPASIEECLGTWIKSFLKEDKKLVLVGISALFWTLWKCRNGVIFDNKFFTDPMTLIKLMCRWILDWSILQIKEQNREVMELGIKLLERVANEVYKASQGWRYNVARLEG